MISNKLDHAIVMQRLQMVRIFGTNSTFSRIESLSFDLFLQLHRYYERKIYFQILQKLKRTRLHQWAIYNHLSLFRVLQNEWMEIAPVLMLRKGINQHYFIDLKNLLHFVFYTNRIYLRERERERDKCRATKHNQIDEIFIPIHQTARNATTATGKIVPLQFLH